jgi:outer membrane receptor protein involved in Fe transport
MKNIRQTRSAALRSGMLLTALLLPFLIFQPLHAQESRATLEGRVTDQQGASIPGATVIVNSELTGVKQQTVANDQGAWTIRFLNPGVYTISISAPSFKSSERRGVTLQVADSKRIDTTLEPGDISEHVVVTSDAPLIDTDSATSGTVIESATITELPNQSRIPYLLADLSPGVLTQDQNNNVPFMWSNVAASAIRVNGGRDNRSNEFTLDGMPNQRGDRVAFIPPTDAVAEFRIMSNAYDVQYGRQSGGTINVSLKSGTGKYHGDLYEFHQNSSLNANLFQLNRAGQPKVVAHYNLYGGTFGGPVWIPRLYQGKEKTFFFASWEGIRNKDPRLSTISVPTELERQGDFRQSFTTQLIGGRPVRVPITIYDPLTVDTRPTINQGGKEVPNPTFGFRQPFPNNQIPAERINPIARKILEFVPLPNSPSQETGNAVNNFTPNTTRQVKMASFVLRLDHTFSNRHKSFATIRWNHKDEFLDDHFDSLATGNFLVRMNKGLGLDHVWTISPNKILNLRYNLARFEEPNSHQSAGLDPKTLGFGQDFVSKMVKLSFPRITGLFRDFLGNDIVGGGAGDYFNSTYHNWNANLTHVISSPIGDGSMTLQYGGEFRLLQEADGNFGNQSGQFDFNANWTRRRYNTGETGSGTALASFLLGLPSGGNIPRNVDRFSTQHYYAFFLQDNWRATKRLTVNLGLRWDYQRPFIERFNRMTSVFDPTALNPISDAAQSAYATVLSQVLANPTLYPFGQQLAQLVPVSSFKVYGAQRFAGVDGQPRAATSGDFSQWQPRAGFAYQITPKTVIRGGFGRFTASSGIKGGQNGFERTTPFLSSIDSGLTPYDTLSNPFRNGILEPTGSSLGPLTNLGQGVSWVNQNPGIPYSWEASLHLQREYKSWLFEIGYSHNKTYDIAFTLNQNDIGFDNWMAYRTPRFDSTGRPLARPYLSDEQIPNPFRGLPGVSGARSTNQNISIYDLLRPLKLLGNQGMSDNPWGKTQYDSLQARIQRRFSNGFSLITAYTFSKLFEDTAFWGPEISGPIPEHKLGGEDRPHKLSLAPIYELPFGRHKKFFSEMPKLADAILGGWQLTGQFTIQSGAPIVFGNDSFYDGEDFHLSRGDRTLSRWFDTSHFVKFPNANDDISLYPAWTGVQNLPGANYKPSGPNDPRNGVYADFGNYVRRYPTRWANVRASRVNVLNLGIYKNFRLREAWKIQVRGEAFNAFNHPRFGGPNTDPGSANFGVVDPSQQNQPRVLQLAIKINF